MKNIFLSLVAVAALFAACSQDNENVIPTTGTEDKGILEFGASLPSTRTYLNGNEVYWSEGDKLTVWSDEVQSPRTYVQSAFGSTPQSATFTFTPTAEIPTGVSGSEYYAIYPQSPKTTVSGNVAYIELPATQKCQDINKTMNFLPTFNPMAATSADHNNLEFKNLCGIVVVTVTPDQDLTLTEIILETADSKALCGAATVTMGATPTMEMTEVTTANKQVSLACENMALTAGTAYSFYIVVPAATYNDFGVKIYTNKKRNEPSLYKVRTNRPLELQAGMITTIGANFNLITREPVKYKVGDKYPYNAADEDVQGIVFSIDNPDSNMQGLTGRIMALEDCGTADEVYKWGPATGYALTADSSDGSVNMETVTEAGISNYPAFAACAALTTGGLSWYLPATDELQAIVNNYTKLEITWRAIKNDNTNDMLPAMQYWTSTLGGAKSKVVYYYDFDTETMASERVANLGTAEYAVRAVAKFTSK